MIDEGSRHALFQRLEHVLGEKEAMTLMQHLPPVGWADVATKDYLDLRLQSTENKLHALFSREIGTVRDEINRQTRAMVFSAVTLFVTVVLGLFGVVFSMGQFLS